MRPAGGAASQLPPGWEEHFDDHHNRTYWYNEATGESTWQRPVVRPRPPLPAAPPPRQQPRWEQFTDDNSGLPYWYCEATGESRWEPPTNASTGAPAAAPAKGGGGVPARGGQPYAGGPPIAVRPPTAGISAPAAALSGRVKAWKNDKGFGFITQDNGGGDLFVNRAIFAGGSREASLIVGEQVFYTPPVEDRRNPGKETVTKLWGPGVDCGPAPGQLPGTVKAWKQDKGFGFIIQDNGGEDIFVNRVVFAGANRDSQLLVGKRVWYDPPQPDPRKPGSMTTFRLQGPGVFIEGGQIPNQAPAVPSVPALPAICGPASPNAGKGGWGAG
eukprot:TRINITY_DN16673_c0_g1_i1.p1 TRINITY_DN16673_c0_g1~~TRINITY_DN16673_c0_g1_i1.p1  ORF type:complete len:329 (+),score=40.18 TRINITY_DN16673_c0_g1_i1:148-1134(+)